jgi:hypothetical protein
MKKSENACRSWNLGFKKHKFSDFFIGPVFFIAIRLTICGGGSAPPEFFAANAVLIRMHRMRANYALQLLSAPPIARERMIVSYVAIDSNTPIATRGSVAARPRAAAC